MRRMGWIVDAVDICQTWFENSTPKIAKSKRNCYGRRFRILLEFLLGEIQECLYEEDLYLDIKKYLCFNSSRILT